MRLAQLAIATALVGGACTGTEGTVSVGLTSAPGSPLIASIQTLRFIVTNPTVVTVAERGADGFAVALDLPDGGSRAVVIEGLDASGAVIATGASPVFPTNAITARIVVYLAPPMSIAAAPASVSPARSELGVGALSYGAIFVGGRDAAQTVSGAIAIYNAYDHTIVAGMPLTVPRAAVTVAVTGANNAYIFGGRDASGIASGNLALFQTGVPPTGAFTELGDHAEIARAGAIAVRADVDQFIVSGSPVLELAGNGIAARTDIAELAAVGASVTASNGATTAIFACSGATGLARFRTNQLDTLAGDPALTDATAAAVPGGAVVVAGGRHTTPAVEILRDLTHIDPITGAVVVTPALETPREHAAVAATRRHILVAGGRGADLLPVPTAEVFDATSFAHLATLQLVVPRSDAQAIALPNDQILIIGGVDADGKPIGIIELFTPPTPDL